MKNTTHEIKETTIEQGHKVTYTKTIRIEEKNYYGKTQYYQTETIHRNNVIVSSAQYPANTEYAQDRRNLAGMNN